MLSKLAVTSLPLPQFALWEKTHGKRIPFSFDLEITSRCNNDCRHCYINRPASDIEAKKRELTLDEIKEISQEAVSLGALWSLITGGEPLLREDFFDIYLALKRKGLLLSVFTNANLISKEHIKFFKRYPPRDIEVSVYGVTKETYERITRKSGSFDAFMHGVDLLLKSGIKVRFKAMALRSNYHEMLQISTFCRERTKDYFRFDPFLNLRYDSNSSRNLEIKSERLTPLEIVALERQDSTRFKALKKNCDKLIIPDFAHKSCNHLFYCGAGINNFVLSFEGLFRLCSPLWHPDCVYDLRHGNLSDAWNNFVPEIREMRSDKSEALKNCLTCTLINLCMWCPANAYLETGEIDSWVDYFCKVAHVRADILKRA